LVKSVQTDAYLALIGTLHQARKSAGLTQGEVARRLRRPQSFVSKYEQGERRLDVLEFVLVARALRLNPVPLIKELSTKVSRL
jgi:transcriptional regulator with XRE-family HTH domain